MSDRFLHHEGPERPSQDWVGGPERSQPSPDLPVPKGKEIWERIQGHEDTPLNLTRKQRERLQRVLMDACQRNYTLNAKERAAVLLRRIENEV